jgi:hypothetical protein
VIHLLSYAGRVDLEDCGMSRITEKTEAEETACACRKMEHTASSKNSLHT